MINLRQSAKGQECMIRIPGDPEICNNDPSTTVLAHLNGGKGAGQKNPDILGAFACSNCHDVVDRRRNRELDKEWVYFMHLQGVIRTQRWWLENGYLAYPSMDIMLIDFRGHSRYNRWMKKLISKIQFKA